MKSKIKQLIYFATCATVLLLIAWPGNRAMAQVGDRPINKKLEAVATPRSTANWVDFREGTTINPITIFTEYKEGFELSDGDQMKMIKKETDGLGFNHYRYQQYYKNLKVLYGEFIVHQDASGFVKSANGRLINGLNLTNTGSISEVQALSSALVFMNAKKYLWQNPEMEKELKRIENNSNASYYPVGELLFAPASSESLKAADYRLAWHFKIYTDASASDVLSKNVYVDAISGKVISAVDISMKCSGGSGGSAYNGSVSFNTSSSFGLFFSHNDCQATDIYVYNCNGGNAANNLYVDADNSWIIGQQSEVQAQWGALQTYSYYIGQHSRTSWDNGAGDMIAYNNSNATGLGPNNACWGCTGNSTIFGMGSTSAATDDWNTDDIMGHEFTHGVTQASANLAYNKESGGLNESFSDIFGEMVESWAEGNCDYLVGADRGAIRSFITPKTYGQPDTYLGTNWFSTTSCTPSSSNDNCGVHTNSGVQNHWFYLLSEGGSGTNDFGTSYNVTGITRFKARLIAYRALTTYLSSSSQYIDARAATLHAAWDLYGQCSAEIIAVGDAWHAVGVESQSGQFSKNACGTYSSGEFIQAISQLTAANGCATTVNSATNIVYFTARDRVILLPGFKATAGARFIAYLEPCSSTMWRGGDNIIKSDPEKGIFPPVIAAKESPAELLAADQAVRVNPNPFTSTFELTIRAKQDTRAQVVVYNAVGVKVMEKTGVSIMKSINRLSFDGSHLTRGMYMVEVNMEGVRTVKKIIKM